MSDSTTPAQFKQDYPILYEMLDALSQDFNGGWRPNIQLPAHYEAILAQCEQQGARMTQEERDAITTGEEDEIKQVVEKHSAQALDRFLASAYDGNLSKVFFQYGGKQ